MKRKQALVGGFVGFWVSLYSGRFSKFQAVKIETHLNYAT
jgi:hypothetical protein